MIRLQMHDTRGGAGLARSVRSLARSVPGSRAGARVAMLVAAIVFAVSLAVTRPVLAAQPPADQATLPDAAAVASDLWAELRTAAVRLPLAAVLGTALALRPRRRGTPERTPPVVQTQIVLAIVGALIMLVVGASLARAFGIVGAANLIRYRSKIEDPKDAVVMLSSLAVGLASGVGLYLLAGFGTIFLVVALWVIESFEPTRQKTFELAVKLGDDTGDRRNAIEAVLRRNDINFELRTAAQDQVCYLVKTPLDVHTDRVSMALTSLVPEGEGAVEWREAKKS